MDFALLKDWDGQDVSGWLMSEKLDGWRAGWDGNRFISRCGEVLSCPEWFLEGLPSCPLDGELFAGRGRFNGISGMVAGDWVGLTYEIFDAPSPLPFSERLLDLAYLSLPSHCHAIPQRVCANIGDLWGMGVSVCMEGGEGAVVRRADSLWKAGRSGDVLRYVPKPPRLNRVKAR